MTASAIIRAGEAAGCAPWQRFTLSPASWAALASALQDDPLSLVALWADTASVHALFRQADEVVAASVTVVDGGYPALSPVRPGAAWYERMIHDLWGHRATGGTDGRPWLDHGTWPHTAPLSSRPGPPPAMREPPEFLPAQPETAMQLGLGPVGGNPGEAAHLRLTLRGDGVLQAESRLGYAHKGTLALMRGKSPRVAARFAARLAGDATVAHALAFASAAEAALGITVPPRAAALRAIMLEIERIAGHLDQVGALALGDEVHAVASASREGLLRACAVAFGHRLMMDCVVPGGLAVDVAAGGIPALLRAMGGVATDLPVLRRLHQGTGFASRLTGVGVTTATDVRALAVGGVVARAAGALWDARRLDPLLAPLLPPSRARSGAGDTAGRARLRLLEIGDSLHLIGALLEGLADGPVSIALPMVSGEGFGCAESVRGDVWCWLRLDHGQIASSFPRDPGWALWPLAERVLAGEAMEDVALVRCSLGLPASGMDL